MNVNAYRDRVIINVAAFPRSFGVGLMGVLLGIYLSRIGFSPLRIGAVVAIGSAVRLWQQQRSLTVVMEEGAF